MGGLHNALHVRRFRADDEEAGRKIRQLLHVLRPVLTENVAVDFDGADDHSCSHLHRRQVDTLRMAQRQYEQSE